VQCRTSVLQHRVHKPAVCLSTLPFVQGAPGTVRFSCIAIPIGPHRAAGLRGTHALPQKVLRVSPLQAPICVCAMQVVLARPLWSLRNALNFVALCKAVARKSLHGCCTWAPPTRVRLSRDYRRTSATAQNRVLPVWACGCRDVRERSGFARFGMRLMHANLHG
jgi:hypothetical protein